LAGAKAPAPYSPAERAELAAIARAQRRLPILRQLLYRLRRYHCGNRLVGHLPSQTQRSLHGDAEEAEPLVGEDLDLLPLRKITVQPGDLVNLAVADFLALLAERLAHLDEILAGVDELDLAAPLRRLAVRDHPEVRRNAGVVEELVRQRDHGLQPANLDAEVKLVYDIPGGLGEAPDVQLERVGDRIRVV
jgi:hypothetical protein